MRRIWKSLASTSTWAEEERALLMTVPAADYLHGIVGVAREQAESDEEGESRPVEGGWVRPLRMNEAQRRALTSCLAWHPGLYRQSMDATAGVSVRFRTDADEVALAIRLDGIPQATLKRLGPARDVRERGIAADGVSAMVDGKHVGMADLRTVASSIPWIEVTEGMALACVTLRAADTASYGEDDDVQSLSDPGHGTVHEVILWLPCLQGCQVRELWCDGTFVDPVPEGPRLLVLGDASGQGLGAADPARAWPVILADSLGLELMNQSVMGQVFQPTMLIGADMSEVTSVLVQLGESYRHEACSASAVSRDVRAFLSLARSVWRDAEVWVVTPQRHDEVAHPSHELSCWREVPAILRVAARSAGAQVVDGSYLCDFDELSEDASGFPSATGHAQMAERLATAMRQGASQNR